MLNSRIFNERIPTMPTVTTDITLDYTTDPVTNKNFLKPNSFKFVFTRLPTVEYYCQSASIPKMTLGAAMQPTPFVNVKHAGDKMEYEQLDITFMVDENMTNFLELYNWMVGLGFPKSHDQFANLAVQNSRFATTKMLEVSQYSDASMFILDSNNKPVVEVRFKNCFPQSIEALPFDIRIPTVDYFTGIATIAYEMYEIVPVNSSYDSLI